MKVSEIGEFGLIARLAKMAQKSAGKDAAAFKQLLVGIGDDAAAYFANNEIQLATVDSLVQHVHFSLSYMSWQELGWKSIVVNLSDIAAMGGFPRYALVSLGLPPDTEVEEVVAPLPRDVRYRWQIRPGNCRRRYGQFAGCFCQRDRHRQRRGQEKGYAAAFSGKTWR